jgi:hypothetical protein
MGRFFLSFYSRSLTVNRGSFLFLVGSGDKRQSRKRFRMLFALCSPTDVLRRRRLYSNPHSIIPSR